jgi:flagellar export protein FliJ
MRRFRFRLERLLGLRRLRTQLQKQQVAAARLRLLEAQDRLVEAQQAYRQTSDSLCQREIAGTTASLLEHGRLHLGRLAEAVAVHEGTVKAAGVALQQARAELSTARRAERALERLRERRWQQHRQEGLKREQAQLDEMSMARVGREALP